ncbi:MFS transporter [Herpetosiphon sp. NSE202]|uniref:MFS transporter n=1 Tax=Herpetosiphon sp. NSE202 TaxID=3351349 RepID=UPI00362DC6D5
MQPVQGGHQGSMKMFSIIWFGQLLSLIGSGLTSFALGIWIYKQNDSVTQLTLISLFTTIPGLVTGPLIGALVDRWDRRIVMILSDLVSALSILTMALLYFSNLLAFWHICFGVAINSITGAFFWPAYHASTALLVPTKQLGRAGGMNEIAYAATQLIAPILGAALLNGIGLSAIFMIDGISFLLALSTLLFVRIPTLTSAEAAKPKASLWREALYGWTYIRARNGLLALLIFAVVTRFVMGSVNILATPLVLAFSNEQTLGTIMSIGGVGAVIGSIAMTSWGGPKRRIYGVLGGELIGGICILIAGLKPSIPLFGIAIFIYLLRWPIGLISNQAIWLSKIAPEVQGRVLSIRQLIGFSALPLSYVVSGPLVDNVLEPLFAPGGGLANSVGQLIGIGPGRGIAFLFVLMGTLVIVASIVGFMNPRLRMVEQELPDVRASSMAQPEVRTHEHEPVIETSAI